MLNLSVRSFGSQGWIGLVLVAMLFAACSSVGPTLSRESERKAGPYPVDYKELVRHWADTELADTSAVVGLTVTKPVPGTSKPLLFGEQKFGWFVRVTFKPRDSLGMSKGKFVYGLLIRDRQVIDSQKDVK